MDISKTKCQSCLELKVSSSVTEDHRNIFQTLIGIEVRKKIKNQKKILIYYFKLFDDCICVDCMKTLLDFKEFRNKIRNNRHFIKSKMFCVKVEEEESEFLITDIKAEPLSFEQEYELPIFYDELPKKSRKLNTGLVKSSQVITKPSTIPESGFKCQYCEQKFAQKLMVVEHINIDHNFNCSRCPSIFQYEISLIKHEVSVHGPSLHQHEQKFTRNFRHFKFVCNICNFKFNDEMSLSNHVEKHEQMDGKQILPKSLEIFSKRERKKVTNQAKHSFEACEDQVNEGIKESEKRKIRANNNRTQENQIILQDSTKSQARSINDQSEAEKETLPHWKFVLKSHQMKQYPGRKLATELNTSQCRMFSVPCIDCGLQILPELMSLHRIKHHEKASACYTCDTCNERVQGKINLDGHMKLKHLKNFMKNHCLHCSKDFDSRLAMIHHINQVHADKGSFICSICEKIFKTSKEMKKHRKIHQSSKKKMKIIPIV